MRFLIALLLALSFNVAHAGDTPPYLGKIENKGGGEIVLLLSKNTLRCRANERGLDVIAYGSDGTTLEGCWENLDGVGMVKVTWSDGEVRVYPHDRIQLHPVLQAEVENEVESKRSDPAPTRQRL